MAYTQAQIAKAERLIAKAMSLSQDIDPQRESIEKQLRAEIKKAYQALIQQYHPDRVADMGPELRDVAEERTKEINAAYEELKRQHR